jgi:CubicO group peptidase (beta-lactamase class C family)
MSSPDEVQPTTAMLTPGAPRQEVLRQLEQRVEKEQVRGRLPSLVVGLVRDGSLIWWGGRGSSGIVGGGSASADTQYRIGSITKTFVAVAVLRLRDEGAVELSDRIGDHLPELAELPVTIAELLSHTSGLRAEAPGPWWERTPGKPFGDLVASSLRRQDLLWRPGRRFHYSNLGYAVLGELVARHRSAPFPEVLRSEIWGPLGMRRTTILPEPPHARGLAVHPHLDAILQEPAHDAVAMAPAGQLWSTVEDLARWSEVLLGMRSDVLGPASASEMAEPVGLMDVPGQAWTAAYGLGLQLWNNGGSRRCGHSGAMPGHWAMVLIDPAAKDVVVALANSTYQGMRPAFFDELLELLAAEQPRPTEAFRPTASAFEQSILELLGTWYWGPVEHSIRMRADAHLELQGVPAGGRDCHFRPAGDGTYVGESGYFDGERLVVHRRPNGSISYLDIASFVFTRTPYDPSADIPGGIDEKGWHAY